MEMLHDHLSVVDDEGTEEESADDRESRVSKGTLQEDLFRQITAAYEYIYSFNLFVVMVECSSCLTCMKLPTTRRTNREKSVAPMNLKSRLDWNV